LSSVDLIANIKLLWDGEKRGGTNQEKQVDIEQEQQKQQCPAPFALFRHGWHIFPFFSRTRI